MFSEHAFSLRKDLIASQIRMGREPMWILKDPLNGRFFYFDEHEYAILKSLDGKTPVRSICTELCRRFAPWILSQEQLLLFLAELSEADLLTGTGSEHSLKRSSTGRSAQPGRQREGWGNLLALRLPGINPTAILDVVAPRLSWMFRPGVVLAALFLMIAALLVLLTHFEDYMASLPAGEDWSTPPVILTTILTIAVAKIMHELAHALTARHFHVRCDSMGIMLLFLMPCLYCDVTDAWKVPERRKRIAISAAGMAAELFIAAIAVCLWTIAAPGPVRTTLAILMAVCSINTLLLNGNPLMRYDGYYIFSDLVGIPNLAPAASQVISQLFRDWIWGTDDLVPPPPVKHRRFLITYGVLSFFYRMSVLGILVYAFYRTFGEWKLASVGFALATVVVAPFSVLIIRRLVTPPPGFLFLDAASVRRPMVAGGVALGLLLAVFLIPLPRRIDVPFRIESAQSREVFITVPGQLTFVLPAGAKVKQGDILAELRSHDVEQELQALDISLKTLVSRRRGLEARRSLLGEADELPALIEQIQAVQNNRKLLERKREELTIRAPVSGILAAPPNRPRERDDRHQAARWFGTPLDAEMRQCYLEKGTLLGIVTPVQSRQATLYVTQRRIQKLAADAAVRIWWPGARGNCLHARVVDASPTPLEQVPREILTKQLLPVTQTTQTESQSLEPVYHVSAELAPAEIEIPLRTSGWASIRGRPTSLWTTAREWILDAFDL